MKKVASYVWRYKRSSVQGPHKGSLVLRFSIEKPGVQCALLIKLHCQTVSLNVMILAEREKLALYMT